MRSTDRSTTLECYDQYQGSVMHVTYKNMLALINSMLIIIISPHFSHCEPDRASVVAVHVAGQVAEGLPLPRGLTPNPRGAVQ